jgi:transposase-like protein
VPYNRVVRDDAKGTEIVRPFIPYVRWASQQRKGKMTQRIKDLGVKCYNCNSSDIEALGSDIAQGYDKFCCKNCGANWSVVKKQ